MKTNDKNPDASSSEDQHNCVGKVLTGAYLFTIAALIAVRWADFCNLKLNELGDFLAGVFGPIAFLWLVLGYVQQGRELRINSEALRLQAEELANSVTQQKEIAEATWTQVNQLLENHRANVQLSFEFIKEHTSKCIFEMRLCLKNHGYRCTELMLAIPACTRHIDIPVPTPQHVFLHAFGTNEEFTDSFFFHMPSEQSEESLFLRYRDGTGQLKMTRWRLFKASTTFNLMWEAEDQITAPSPTAAHPPQESP